jgi:hypothetical protein
MAPIGLALTTVIPGGSAALDATDAGRVAPSQVVYHVPPASQAPAAPSDATRQDTVTLSGTAPTARSQPTAQNFVTTAAFRLLAHEYTFPPNDSGNGASTDGAANSYATGAPAEQTTVAQEPPPAPILTQASINATAVAVAAAAGQPAAAGNPASGATTAANSAAFEGANAGTPKETIQQLDKELQQLGINPQDISLLNRMALLLWVNDPEALRQFVQGLQPSAGTPETTAAANTLDAPTGAGQIGAGGAGSASLGAGNAAIESAAVQSQPQNQDAVAPSVQSQVSAQETNQNSGGVSDSGPAGSANTPELRTGAAVLQLQQLHASLAAAGQDARGGFYGSANSRTPGQLLNISA